MTPGGPGHDNLIKCIKACCIYPNIHSTMIFMFQVRDSQIVFSSKKKIVVCESVTEDGNYAKK